LTAGEITSQALHDGIMDALQLIRRSFAHSAWSDVLLLDALRAHPELTAARREYSHVVAVQEVWLARIERRTAAAPIWPDLTLEQADALRRDVAAAYERFLSTLTSDALERQCEYTNSVGQAFQTPTVDILQHVALHSQYHRGKINLLLRQAGAEPAPVDFISFVRGVPAAVTRLA
jgi:uncharacterized damage-inducible protein DinB